MTTKEIIAQAETLLAGAKAMEQRVIELGKLVDARDPQVARAQRIVDEVAEQNLSPLGRQIARRELGRLRSK